MSNHQNFPAHLFIGNEQQAIDAVLLRLQKAFCPQQTNPSPGCFCTECKKIKNFQHPCIVWIKPENKYVVDDLEVVFDKIRFALEPNQQFFFVLQQAHTLSPVCANKLLKTLEEPPSGYSFFLLAQNEYSILPTIKSRCIIHSLTPAGSRGALHHPLLFFFQNPSKLSDTISFEQELQKSQISEQETVDLLQEFANELRGHLKTIAAPCTTADELESLCAQKQFLQLQNALNYMETQLRKPPQAGSAALFWKKLFLTFPRP